MLAQGTPSLAEPATIHAVINEVTKVYYFRANAEIDLEAWKLYSQVEPCHIILLIATLSGVILMITS